MSRWHETGCRHPDVAVVSGLPCCNYCFALPSLEERGLNAATNIVPLPRLGSRARMNLTWPSVVSYSQRPGASTQPGQDESIVESDYVYVCPTDVVLTIPPSDGDSVHGSAPQERPTAVKDSKLQYQATIYPELTSDDEIRLLRLSPSQEDGPIHAQVELARLDSPSRPVYEALSYTRADESGSPRRGPIFIGPYWDVVYVASECEEALRGVRRQEVDRLIWVDALCINQRDADEKTYQTRLTREIYASAARVILYLGDTSSDSDVALDFLERTAAPANSASSMSQYHAAIDQPTRTALETLFERRYFSRLWAAQEALLADHLEIVCGQRSVSWPNRPSVPGLSSSSAPSWLYNRSSWCGFTGRGILRLMLNAYQLKSSDPRDKVFGMLSLIRDRDLSPNYRLPVETVYTGLAAYLVKNCLAFEVLALASTGKKDYNIPSWVPDWSQHSVTSWSDASLYFMKFFPMPVISIDNALPLVFDSAADFKSIEDSEPEIKIDADTGSLQISALKLCHISGEIFQVKVQDKDKIVIGMAMGEHGTLIVSPLDQTYTIGDNFLFLLHEWDHPVILRRHSGTASYSLVSVCTLFFQPALSAKWRTALDNPWMRPKMHEIRVTRFLPDENYPMLAFHSTLTRLFADHSSSTPESTVPDPFSVVRARIFDFGLLSLTALGNIESRLKNTWDQLDQHLGWMFLDKLAVWKFIQDLNQSDRDTRSGEGSMRLEDWEKDGFEQHCNLTFPSTYEWDLGSFSWSFVRSHVPESEALESTWTPVFLQLNSHLPEIQRWAEVTEQLLKVFEYSQSILGKSWDSFPGTSLPERWFRNWQNFCDAVGSETGGSDSQSLGNECLWDWSEFRSCLNQREQLFDRSIVPGELNPVLSDKMGAHLAVKSLGLNFEQATVVNII